MIFPAKHYLVALFILGVSLILAVNYSLYTQGQDIQQQVHAEAHIEAQKELYSAIEHSFATIDQQLKALSSWDEVHQQIASPSYYFYWHSQRLKESSFFKEYYVELEIYDADHHKLALVNDRDFLSVLPRKRLQETRYFLIQPLRKDLLVATKPIYERHNPSKVIGYVSVAIDFYAMLAKESQFYYLDFNQLHFNRSGLITFDELQGALNFKSISNPVSDQLWTLIEDFVFQFSLASVLIALVLVWLTSLFFILPLRKLSNYLRQLSEHPTQNPQDSNQLYLIEEYSGLHNQLTEYHRALLDAQTTLTDKNQQLWNLSRQDPLTELPNRRAFDEAWSTILSNHQTNPASVSYLLFDCDRFKAFNDSYGHQLGDRILQETAKILKRTLDNIPVYRIAGDEFVVILTGLNTQQVEQLGAECQKHITAYPFEQLGILEKVNFSLGISFASADQPLSTLELLPKQANVAMYKAKSSPLSNLHFYQHERDESSKALVSSQVLNSVLAAAHNGTGICLHYQPILSLENQSLCYEVLVRIDCDDSIIYPNEIFTIIEHHGLEVELDQNILNTLIEQLQNQVILHGQGVSINLSAKTLLQPYLVDLFEPFLPYLKHHKIVVEITENLLINHFSQVVYALNKLRRQGFLIALDDFGRGNSAIRYLTNMPVDIVKFDISLTHALDAETKTVGIIHATAQMILNAGYQLVMEGVETQTQLLGAQQAGATHVQGYLIGYPKATPQPPGLYTPLRGERL